MSNDNGDGWNFNRLITQIPLVIWVTLIGQASAFIIWMIKLDDRVADSQKQVAEISARVSFMDERDTHAGNIVGERVRQLEQNQGWIVRRIWRLDDVNKGRLPDIEKDTPPPGKVPN